MLTQNVVENDFSQQRQAMGGGRNPDAKSVCSTMCMLRNRAGLTQLTALVGKGKLSYADMDTELVDSETRRPVIEVHEGAWAEAGAVDEHGVLHLLLDDSPMEEDAAAGLGAADEAAAGQGAADSSQGLSPPTAQGVQGGRADLVHGHA